MPHGRSLTFASLLVPGPASEEWTKTQARP